MVAEGFVIPGAEILARRDELQEYFPAPAPRNANLTVILQAVAAIIADSKLRASQLLYSPSILAVLPGGQPTDYIAGQVNRTEWNSFATITASSKKRGHSALDYLLPLLPIHHNKPTNAQSTAFPPLGTSASRENLTANSRSASHKQGSGSHISTWFTTSKTGDANVIDNIDVDDSESPLVAYLILILRSRNDLERVAAASVLAVLYRMGLTSKTRELAIGTLVIPLLLDLLLQDPRTTSGRDSAVDDETLSRFRTVREKTPIVLAMFITDNEYLQKAAFNAHAIPRLCTMLKVAYDPVPKSSIPAPWAPIPTLGGEIDESQTPLTGSLGMSPLLLHNIKVRESTLKAIASIVPFKDEYRKKVVDEGLVPYIVESMNAHPGKPTPKSNEKSDKTNTNGALNVDSDSNRVYGINPLSVMIAACGAIRALSRSVSILRTTLIDNGIAPPVISLLHHPDLEVQIAATATMCNLVTDISPMRDVSNSPKFIFTY